MEKPSIPLVEAFKMMQVNEEESLSENGEATHEEVCFCTSKMSTKTSDLCLVFVTSNSIFCMLQTTLPHVCLYMHEEDIRVSLDPVKKLGWIYRQDICHCIF